MKIVFVAILLTVLSLVIDVYSLLTLYELDFLDLTRGRSSVAYMLAISTLIKIIGIVLVVGKADRGFFRFSVFVLIAAALALGLKFGPIKDVLSHTLWSESLFSVSISKAIVYLATFIAWIGFSGAIARNPNTLNGYRSVLSNACLIISLSMLAIVFQTPLILGHILFDVAVLGYALSLQNPNKSLWNFANSNKKQKLYGAIIFGPIALYVAPIVLSVLGFFSEHGAEIGNAILTQDTEMVEVADPSLFYTEALSDYRIHSKTQLFNDIHRFNDDRMCAIDNRQFLCQENGLWKELATFEQSVSALRFTGDGSRGVANNADDYYSVTHDGGKNWAPLSPAIVHAAHTGLNLESSEELSYSRLYFDLETGESSFVIDCQYYYSDDHGNSWRSLKIKDNEGKSLCMRSSPFSVDAQAGYAIVRNEDTIDLVIRNNDTQTWETLCIVRDTSLFRPKVSADETCKNDTSLSPTQTDFLDRFDNKLVSQSPDWVDFADLVKLLGGENVESESLGNAIRTNGNYRWIAQQGAWLESNDNAQTWSAHYLVPELSNIWPIDKTRAYGISNGYSSEESIFISSDAGKTWQVLNIDEDIDYELYRYNPSTQSMWLANSTHLLQYLPSDLDNPREIALPESEYVTDIQVSSNDSQLIITADSKIYFTSDFANWIAIEKEEDVPENEKYIDEDGEIMDAYLENSQCQFTNTPECVLWYSNGTVKIVQFDAKTQQIAARELPILPIDIERDFSDIQIRSILPGPTYIAVADGRSTAFLLEQDAHKWKKVSLNSYSDWYTFELVDNNQSLLISDAESRILGIQSNGEVTNLNAGQWSESIGHCFDATGTTGVVFDFWENIAITQDKMQSWKTTKKEQVGSLSCGFSSDQFWLLNQDMLVFERNPQ